MSELGPRLSYGREVRTGLSFIAAIEAVRARLQDEGFGVLCDIDVEAAMRDKLGAEFRPYRILGACNPSLAHRALQAHPAIGLLLPCNVVVQDAGGTTLVSAIDARALLGVVGDASMGDLADEVNARLGRVLDAIEGAR